MKTNKVKIGNIEIGGGNKIAIQSMTNISVLDIDNTAEQLKQLQLAGCDIVRVAINNYECAKALPKLKQYTTMPIVADTHFDAKLTIQAIENGADKVRINPGNMALAEMKKVTDCATKHNVPIRIGVNGGSVSKTYLQQTNGNKKQAIINNLMDYVKGFEKLNFNNLVLSVKSSDVLETIEINRTISQLTNHPLHIGVTEAGIYKQGVVKNSIGIGALLADNIGDTIRVSLTDEPVAEVETAKLILNALGKGGVTFVSCPKCGRCSIDLYQLSTTIYDIVSKIDANIKIAVMGCEVNGPGECADADLGIAGGGLGKVALFKHGKVFAVVDECDAVTEFTKELNKLC